MSELREAAQAVVDQWDTPNWKLTVHTGVLIDRLRAALAQPETTAADLRVYDAIAANYAHPPRDEWRDAVHDELVTTWTVSGENAGNPRLALRDIINWHVRVALDPAVSSDAQALIDQGKAMRDVTPPTEGER